MSDEMKRKFSFLNMLNEILRVLVSMRFKFILLYFLFYFSL